MAIISGTDAGEELDGTADTDTINGLGGNDTIYGNGGSDTITGDDGDDVVSVQGSSGADSIDGGIGDDSVSAFFAVGDSVTGGTGNDLIQIGSSTTGLIDGGADSDSLETSGYDISGLTISNIEMLQTQTGSVKMTAGQVGLFQSIISTLDPSAAVSVTLMDSGAADFSGNTAQGVHLALYMDGDTVTTGGGDDVIDGYGGHAASTIKAGGGNDFITVSYGGDSIEAGSGDDTINALYAAGDSIDAGIGNDLIYAPPSVASPVSGMVDGGGDTDTLYAFGSGTDLSELTISNVEVLQNVDTDGAVSMRAGQAGLFQTIADFTDPSTSVSVRLTDSGVADFSANTPYGISVTTSALGDSVRTGGANDSLIGGAGDDTLEAGAGSDQIDGGGGVNAVSYTYATTGVQVSLQDGGGTAGDALGDTLTGIQTIIGSALADGLTGDDNANSLDGGLGADTLTGLAGDDRYYADSNGDIAIEAVSGGTDTVFAFVSYKLAAGQSIETLQAANGAATTAINLTGNDLAQGLTGNAGVNTLDGGFGADTMAGLGGNDTYRVDSALDQVTEAVGGGSDTVFSTASYVVQPGQSIELLATASRAGTASIGLTGNALAQRLDGNYGDNVLTSGGGGDTLNGFLGNDAFHVSDSNDRVYESVGQGSDTVLTSVSYSLLNGQSVEVLATESAAGTDVLTLSGNSYAQRIEGNAGNNVIDGRGGGDTLYGHLGNDSYRVASNADLVSEVVGEGSDTVFAASSYGLQVGQSVDYLATSSRAGTASINLSGNDLAQRIDGNYGNNILTGGGGGDALYGFLGDDKFYVAGAADKVYEAAGQGSDLVLTSATFALSTGQSVEYLATTVRTGTAALTLTGNDQAQRIDGNYGVNTLNGGDGNDSLYGFDGDDRLNGGNGRDVMDGGSGGDSFAYSAVMQSTGAGRDLIQNINWAQDNIDLPSIPTGIDAKVIVGALNEGSFDGNLAMAIGVGQLAAHHAVLFDPNAGDANVAGRLYLVVDVNGAVGYQAGQDYVIELQSASGTLTLSDFI